MSYKIYICHVCWGPIWFPWGQKTHFGTGWDCWKREQQLDQEVGFAEQPVEFTSSTPAKELKRLTEEAKRLFKRWLEHEEKELLRFLGKQLDKKKDDVVREFLSSLLEEKPEHRQKVVDQLVATQAWDRFVRRVRRAARRGKAKKQKRRTTRRR